VKLLSSDIAAFKAGCRSNSTTRPHIDEKYLDDHLVRLYKTYEVTSALLSSMNSRQTLSIGVGPAFVEAELSRSARASVSVVDFPEVIDANRRYYEEHEFRCFSADITELSTHMFDHDFDLVLACEIVEHLPLPPSTIVEVLASLLAPSGYLVVSTPNASRLANVAKLLLHRPLLEEPERTFGEVSFENEGTHRREYVESEIVDAFERSGVEHVKTHYTWFNSARTLENIVIRPFDSILPRYRPMMIVVGRK
jgi:2-polyprenyl-3-methyl-5-hydroxy-6-metoxy-1,4-benzoquinol methylase